MSGREAKATLKYLRIGPRKVRIVIDAIRGKDVKRAFTILSSINKKGARMAEELLKSAVANANSKYKGIDTDSMIVSEIKADGGPIMKRILTRSMGRADRILKRTTHLSVCIKEK